MLTYDKCVKKIHSQRMILVLLLLEFAGTCDAVCLYVVVTPGGGGRGQGGGGGQCRADLQILS